jgi:hypothetical protein
MAKWRRKESLGQALAREGRGIAKGVFKELLSVGTLGIYKSKKNRGRDDHRGRRW